MKAFKSLESYNYFVSGWVLEVSAKAFGKEIILLAGRVKHSQQLSKAPLVPWIISKRDGQVMTAHCDCMAGLGECCSHVGAVLFFVEAGVRIRNSRTCTQQKSKWIMPNSMKEVSYLPVKKMDFTSASRKKRLLQDMIPSSTTSPAEERRSKLQAKASSIRSSPEDIAKLYDSISKCGSQPAILSIVPDYANGYVPKERKDSLPKPLPSLFQEKNLQLSMKDLQNLGSTVAINLTDEMCKAVAVATKAQAKSKLWFKHRAGRITASRFKAACHTSLEKPSRSLVLQICYPESHQFETPATRWGIQHEKSARKAYEAVMTASHEAFSFSHTGLHLNKTWPYVGASPDGLTVCACCGSGICEIKCPFTYRDSILIDAAKENGFCLKKNANRSLYLSRTHEYYYQIQTQLHIAGVEYCDFVVWTSKDLHIERIESDEVFWDAAIRRANDFFLKALLPELLGKVFSRSTIPHQKVDATPVSHPGNCHVCGNKNRKKLTECQDCSKLFHLSCVGLRRVPKDSWVCKDCATVQHVQKENQPPA